MTMHITIVVVLTVASLTPVAVSVWLVARRGWGLRWVALATALFVGLDLVLQTWAAHILSAGILAVAAVAVAATYGGFWLQRDLFLQLLERAGREARW